MLVHHADAGSQCRSRLAGRQDNSLHLDCSGIGHIMAEQDIHQRGFARTIFAQQPQNFAPVKRQRNIVIGQQGAKRLVMPESRRTVSRSPAGVLPMVRYEDLGSVSSMATAKVPALISASFAATLAFTSSGIFDSKVP